LCYDLELNNTQSWLLRIGEYCAACNVGHGFSRHSTTRAIDRRLSIVEGSKHMQLYDVPKYVDEAVSVLAPFFKANL
jgi:fermentation-respiration switch protein FrsA (DUF1100 family)